MDNQTCKMLSFQTTTMGYKSVRRVGGIEKVTEETLNNAGIYYAYQLYGMLMFLNFDEGALKAWMTQITWALPNHQYMCYRSLHEWHQRYSPVCMFVSEVGAIGQELEEILENAGISDAYQLYGMFMFLDFNEVAFNDWMAKITMGYNDYSKMSHLFRRHVNFSFSLIKAMGGYKYLDVVGRNGAKCYDTARIFNYHQRKRMIHVLKREAFLAWFAQRASLDHENSYLQPFYGWWYNSFPQ